MSCTPTVDFCIASDFKVGLKVCFSLRRLIFRGGVDRFLDCESFCVLVSHISL
jgi:hypothetical protein